VAMAGGLLGLGAVLGTRSGWAPQGHGCAAGGLCGRCKQLDECGLPAAEAARRDRR